VFLGSYREGRQHFARLRVSGLPKEREVDGCQTGGNPAAGLGERGRLLQVEILFQRREGGEPRPPVRRPVDTLKKVEEGRN